MRKTPQALIKYRADFLASPFITTFELPYLLNAAESGGTRILPVIIHPCLFQESPLADFQAINKPTRPLSLLSFGAREQVWVSLVRSLISPPSTTHGMRNEMKTSK